MRYSIVFTAGLAAFVSAKGIDFASIEALPPPAVTGPPVTARFDFVKIDPSSVSSSGAAAATAVTSAAATTSLAVQNKREALVNWEKPCATDACSATKAGWGWGWDKSSSSSHRVAAPTTTPPCAIQPDGYGPKVQPDTPEAFEKYEQFAREANDARTPLGYVNTFKNYNASVSGTTYLGLSTYTSYDVAKCGEHCNSTSLCTGFNIFVERDPSVDPSANCSNPASITNYKCTLWGSSADEKMATNHGQSRDGFKVVIAGSNGYHRPTPPPVCPGWGPPVPCGGGTKAHSHPKSSIGEHFFPGPFNPAYCSAFAAEQNKKNADKISSWKPKRRNSVNPYKCTFFNAYILKKNGQPLGTYCSLFTKSYPGSAAKYNPGKQGQNWWDIESSWSYDLEK
ncbi:hypothetical protein ACMFMF_003051 [Clarireedia jacksonii]